MLMNNNIKLEYQIFTRLDESGALVESQEGFFKGGFGSLEEAEAFAREIPGAYILDYAGELVLPGWSA